MGLLSKIFSKKESATIKTPKGFFEAPIKSITPLTNESVKIAFDLTDLPAEFRNFTPGQYITLSLNINGKEERRSYSICTEPNEGLAIGVKRVTNGLVSNYLTDSLGLDDTILISKPEGNFKLQNAENKVVFIAAGSGITPILSMMKHLERAGKASVLFFGNRSQAQMMFKADIDALQLVDKHYFLSKEVKESSKAGRLDFETLKFLFKEDLSLLRADGFYICGPEPMIKGAIDALNFYGVDESKIHFELFTEAKLLKKESVIVTAAFEGDSKVSLILDGMQTDFPLSTKGQTVLEAALNIGLDAPYSCKGGVCSTCRAKVIEGSVKMNNNLTLTDKEVAEGYILTCQSHPTSETLRISYDD
jgi:ring-1,2-phenylacetyl-CoA epoxidase subunit PaaE